MTGPSEAYPLEGIRVVAIEQAIAVPLATRHLADLGALVIKIENAPLGDFARSYDSLADGVSIHFAWVNRGKQSVVLDLKSADGLGRALDLIAASDVFVHNLRPGAVEKLGLGSEVIARRAPRVINCELSGYGVEGPMAGRKAYDLLIQSELGAASVSGAPDEPAKIGISIVDISGGMYVLSTILAALIQRSRTGQGRTVRLSLFDSIAEWMSVPLLQAKYQGNFQRSGRFHNSIYPYGPFACYDGEVVLAVQNDAEWVRLCTQVIGDGSLTEDTRFDSNEKRHTEREILHPILCEHIGKLSKADLIVRLEAAGVAFAEGRSVEDAVRHPMFESRNRWQLFATEAGTVELLRSPFDTEGGWPTPEGGVPALGEQTKRIEPAERQQGCG